MPGGIADTRVRDIVLRQFYQRRLDAHLLHRARRYLGTDHRFDQVENFRIAQQAENGRTGMRMIFFGIDLAIDQRQRNIEQIDTVGVLRNNARETFGEIAILPGRVDLPAGIQISRQFIQQAGVFLFQRLQILVVENPLDDQVAIFLK